MFATVDELRVGVEDLAVETETVLSVSRGTADGFGRTEVPTLEIVGDSGGRVRVWEEGGRGDFLFEVGVTDEFGAWWGQGRKKQEQLPNVIVELAGGRFELVKGRITVNVSGRAIALREQM